MFQNLSVLFYTVPDVTRSLCILTTCRTHVPVERTCHNIYNESERFCIPLGMHIIEYSYVNCGLNSPGMDYIAEKCSVLGEK